jgi:hypothetical protein
LFFVLSVLGDQITFAIDGKEVVKARDATFTSGGAGFIIEQGTVPAYGFGVRRIRELTRQAAPIERALPARQALEMQA